MLSEFNLLFLLSDIQTTQSSSNRRYHRRIIHILHPHLHTRCLPFHHIRNTTNAVSTRIQRLTNRAQQHTQPFVLQKQITRTNTKTLPIMPILISNPASTIHVILVFPRRRYTFLYSKQHQLTHLEIVIVTVCTQLTYRENIVVYTPKVLDSRERGHFLLLTAPFRVLSILLPTVLQFALNRFRTTLIPQSPIVIQLILRHHHCERIRTVSAGIDEPNSIESWLFHSSIIYNRGMVWLWQWRKWRMCEYGFDWHWCEVRMDWHWCEMRMDWHWCEMRMDWIGVIMKYNDLNWFQITHQTNKHIINNHFPQKTLPCNSP